jgi:hypothetical protein
MLRVVRRTEVLGLRRDLGKKLEEVREVAAEEVGLNDEGLAGVTSAQLSTEKLGFTNDAKC